jgi:hypothetical protein
MKKEFTPYYISRALLSFVFSILVMGFTWKAIIFATVLFSLFLLYLHSGWFRIDLKYPLAPLRRDPRGQEIQRKALIASVIVGLFLYLFSSQLSGLVGLSLSGNIALFLGIITYFVTQFILLART